MLYRFGSYVLDTSRLELSRDHTCVPIEPRPFDLLTYLIENRDRVVPRTELHRRLWGPIIVAENTLNACVKSARRAIGDSGRSQSKIKTVLHRGYRFVADVDPSPHRAFEVEQGPVADEPVARGHRQEKDEENHSLPVSQPSIVVLPFEDLSSDGSGLLFARGLVHDVITRIARSRTMFIIARGTAFKFPSGEFDVKVIGEKLGVRYVVQGAVQILGRKLRVNTALAKARTRQEIWSTAYECTLDDFMLVQEDIAKRIVGELESQVQEEEIQRSLLMPSSNLDAWSAYHRGLHHMYTFKPEGCDRAERFFRRSIELEPGVPRPYAGLSFINFEKVFLGIEPDRSKGIRRAYDYALKSLSTDPLDPMAHWALSRAYLIDRKLDESKEELQAAVRLNPSYAIAHYSMGWVALQLGENELCRDRIDLARMLSPYDPLKFAMLGVYALNLALMGHTRRAARLSVESTLQSNAHHQAIAFAAVTHALDGQLDKARSFFRRVRATAPGYDLKDFLAVYPFQVEKDITRINRAFYDMKTGDRSR